MSSLAFLHEKVEVDETVTVEKDKELDMNRLLDANDDYDELLFNPDRKVVLRDGELVLAVPQPTDVVLEM